MKLTYASSMDPLVTNLLGSIGRTPGDLGVVLPFEDVGVRWFTPLTPGCGVSAISIVMDCWVSLHSRVSMYGGVARSETKPKQ
jgi:hypothetical protein